MRSTVALLTVTVLALIGSAVQAGEVVRSELTSNDTLRNATGGDDLVHEFTQQPERVRVYVRLALKRGEFSWRVEDPKGNKLWDLSFAEKVNFELEEVFPGEAGAWRIVLDYKGARGKYEIKMESVPAD